MTILAEVRRMIEQKRIRWTAAEDGLAQRTRQTVSSVRDGLLRATPIMIEDELVQEARRWLRQTAEAHANEPLLPGFIDNPKYASVNAVFGVRLPLESMFFEWREPGGPNDRSLPCGVLVMQHEQGGLDFMYLLVVSMRGRLPIPLGDMLMRRDKDGTPLVHEIAQYHGNNVYIVDGPNKAAATPVEQRFCTTFIAVVGVAMWGCYVLGGANIVLTPTPHQPTKRKRRKRKAHGPRVAWHHIRVLVQGSRKATGLVVDPKRTPVEPMVAHHMCHGHWKTYTAARPLLGKHVGRYWWRPHARGSKELGVVGHDYTLEKGGNDDGSGSAAGS